MEALTECPTRIADKSLKPDSRMRWSWQEQQAYEIVDGQMYASRFDHFRQFRRDFYAGLDSNPVVAGESDLVFVEHLPLGVAVVGLPSWYGNDCFCHVGDIDRSALSLSRRLLTNSQAPLGIAVWHHSVVGGPRSQDYMDKLVVHRLIDYGFTVGLHGHQHYPDAAPYELRLPNLTSMAVIGAGSLAVGDDQLPPGERRQFNVVVIDPEKASITVHVRAMSAEGIFSGSYREDFGGKTFITLDLPTSPSRPSPPSGRQLLDKAVTAVGLRDYEEAVKCLSKVTDPFYSQAKRQTMIEALQGLERHQELLDILIPPQNADEATLAIALLVDTGRFDEALMVLEEASTLFDSAHRLALTGKIAAERMLYSEPS